MSPTSRKVGRLRGTLWCELLDQLIARERLDDLAAADRVPVWRVAAVEHAVLTRSRDRIRVVLEPAQVGQALSSYPLDFALREGRVGQHIRQQLERAGQCAVSTSVLANRALAMRHRRRGAPR